MHHTVSESVMAGNVMTRRASYVFGRLLPTGPRARVGVGPGKTTSVDGSRMTLARFAGLFDRFTPDFEIVEP